eukprot:362723-Chlamydomonas_euryale.AAC.2
MLFHQPIPPHNLSVAEVHHLQHIRCSSTAQRGRPPPHPCTLPPFHMHAHVRARRMQNPAAHALRMLYAPPSVDPLRQEWHDAVGEVRRTATHARVHGMRRGVARRACARMRNACGVAWCGAHVPGCGMHAAWRGAACMCQDAECMRRLQQEHDQ